MTIKSSVALYEKQHRAFWGTPSIDKNSRTGLILVNLGTPDSLSLKDVKEYLREFLLDPYVVDLPDFIRNILVNKIIVPFRSKKSLEAYEKVWTDEGSPLQFHSEALANKLAMKFPNLKVALAMRYKGKSIDDVYSDLIAEGCRKILVLPLFPQYARATTGSIIAEVDKAYSKINIEHKVYCLPPFYNNELFIKSWAQRISNSESYKSAEHLVMSYHSLPVRQLEKGNYGCRKSECFRAQPCPNFINSPCYRSQCYETSKAIAKELGIADSDYSVSFQSKVGKAEWIKPSTSEHLESLLKQGKKKVAICCPSFVVDCLETLEEIAMAEREAWIEMGGEDLYFIPCLNDQALFVEALSEHVRIELDKL